MSSEDYDQCEKLLCGTWTTSRDENMEEFMTAAGMSEEAKVYGREQTFTITRVGDSFLEKTNYGEIVYKLNEETEWKDKEENPNIHFKTTSTFKDGFWIQETIMLNEGAGKKQQIKSYRLGDELVAEVSLPDVPGVTAKKFFKKA